MTPADNRPTERRRNEREEEPEDPPGHDEEESGEHGSDQARLRDGRRRGAHAEFVTPDAELRSEEDESPSPAED